MTDQLISHPLQQAPNGHNLTIKEDALLLLNRYEFGTALRDLLPVILNLPVWDKLKLISALADDLGHPKNEAETIILPNQIYYFFTPEFEPGGAEQLMQLLPKHR